MKDTAHVQRKDEHSNQPTLQLMLDVYESVLDGTRAAYCSAPITSGKRYIDWLTRIGKTFADIDAAGKAYHEQHFNEVIEPNRVHAQRVIQRLRADLDLVVIDPSAIPYMDGWTQHDWRVFWQRVIERYVDTAFFVDDWPYSNGCVYEFWVAHAKGIPTFDERGEPLSLEAGIRLITEAVAEMKGQGAATAFIERVVQDLKELLAGQRAPHAVS